MSHSVENDGSVGDDDTLDDSPEIAEASKTPRGRKRLAQGLKLKREARFGIAALLSFLILVGVLIVNKWWGKGDTASSGKIPPIAAIDAGRMASTSEPDASEPLEGHSPPPPGPAAVADNKPATETAPTPKEQVRLAMAESTEIPLPAPAPTSEEPKKTADSMGKGEAPIPAPVPPSGETPQPINNAPAPVPVPVDPNQAPVSTPTPTPSQETPVPTAPVEAPVSPPAALEPKRAELGSPPSPSPSVEQPVIPETKPEVSAPSPLGSPAPALELQPTSPTGSAPVPAVVKTDLPILAPAPAVEATPTPAPFKEEAKPAAPGTTGFLPLPTAGTIRPVDEFDRPTPDPITAAERARAAVPPEREPSPVRTTKPFLKPNATVLATGDEAKAERVEAVPHVVQRGENFWTISRLYYPSGRFWKALWAANKATVPAPERLYVGQTIRIPPPEELDRGLIEPERPNAAVGTTNNRPSPTLKVSRAEGVGGRILPALDTTALSDKLGEHEITLPASDPFTRRDVNDAGDNLDSESSPRQRARRTLYKVRPHETLRSIARDTLGDSRRADEILDLNAKILDDPAHLVIGQILELPEDAKLSVSPADRPSRRTRP